MKKNKSYSGRVSLILVILFLIILLGQNIVGAKTVIRVAQGNSATHPIGIGLTHFANRVHELAGEEFEVRLFFDAVLGGDREMIEGVQLGQIDIANATCGNMASFAPEYDIFSLPFLFRDYEHMKKALEIEHFKTTLEEALDGIGLISLGITTSGSRQVYGKKPINTVEDLKGLKIRTMEVPTIMETFKTLGAIPAPIAFGEVYFALQTGVVDAAESSFLSWINSKHVEVAKYGARLNYMDSGRSYFANKKFLEDLSVEQRKIIEQAMNESLEIIIGEYIRQDSEAETTALSYGATVTHPDLAPFIEACQPVYENFVPTLGLEMIKEIQNTK